MIIFRKNDILYSAMPMYHSAAGAALTGNALCEGIPMVSRNKFSAKQFWNDCCSHNVTCAQYIGEIARYLYYTPECEAEKKHTVRMMFGNGMRPEIWQKFTERFGIKQIGEFYGSTEGNCSTMNYSNKVGSVGFVSVLFPSLIPLVVIKVDEHTRAPLRDPKTGLALPCETGEAGELIGKIEKGHPVRDFHGYADKNATEQKIVSNVWSTGDMWFRSGDIFIMDEFGWLYFKDRAGDTFRWKEER